jgi:transposase
MRRQIRRRKYINSSEDTLMTREGIPIAHEIFPGNINDVKSFAKALEIVKQRFSIEKIILVGDRGMVRAPLLEEIENQKLKYIVGLRMRKMRSMDDVLSRRSRYHEVCPNLKVKEVKHQNDH